MAACIQCMQREGDPRAGGLCEVCRPFKYPPILGRGSVYLMSLLLMQKDPD